MLVGAGPGAPELLTPWAVRALKPANLLLHDASSDAAMSELVPRDARRIGAGERCGYHAMSHAMVICLLVRLAQSGADVAIGVGD